MPFCTNTTKPKFDGMENVGLRNIPHTGRDLAAFIIGNLNFKSPIFQPIRLSKIKQNTSSQCICTVTIVFLFSISSC